MSRFARLLRSERRNSTGPPQFPWRSPGSNTVLLTHTRCITNAQIYKHLNGRQKCEFLFWKPLGSEDLQPLPESFIAVKFHMIFGVFSAKRLSWAEKNRRELAGTSVLASNRVS